MTVLGDESYPLRPWLLTPYKQVTGDDYHSRVSYNEVHNCATSYIRSAFRLLIGRFQRLKLIRRKDIQSVRTIVHACCVLHNISRSMENGLPMEFMTSDDEIALYNGNNNCNHAVGGISGSDMEISPDAYEAELLREAVANNLYKMKQNSS